MVVFNYSEARQNFSTVLNKALEEEVIITRKDGNKFKLISIDETDKTKKSPLEDIEGINTGVKMSDILAAIRESRER